MKIIDVTGQIRNDMWNYEYPFPKYQTKPLPQPEWVDTKIYCEIFEGMHSQTGTYIETPAHFFGPENSYYLVDIPIEKFVNIRCSHIKLDRNMFETGKREKITVEMLEEASKDLDIREGDALIFSCGWGEYWSDKKYLECSPFLSYEAMEWLISKKPYLLGSDVPRWENLEKPEGFFDMFYRADIILLSPLVNMEKVGTKNLSLTALPINIADTSCAPCRAYITENN
ncbi:MAG: cyclase family protein [Ruminococcaceae bacterium]|nr:cyclase family protein [Oscillospiraceae bacterium]